MAIEPTLSDVIRSAIEARLVEIHTMKVGRVEKYDNLLQVANIQAVVRRPFNIGAGEVDHESLPLLYNVPVIWPRAADFFMHMPLAVGDHVIIGFTDDDIAAWRTKGDECEPEDLRRHSLGSAVAFAGITPAKEPLSANPLDIAARLAGMCIGEDGTVRQIVWSSDAVTVGRLNPTSARASYVALADRTDARLAALEAQVAVLTTALTALTASVATSTAAIGTHVHPGVTAGTAATGAMASPPAAPGGPPAPFTPNPLTTAADVLKGTGPLP